MEPGSFDQCHACRHPVSDADKASADYKPGISCPHCVGEQSERNRKRAESRQLQVELAAQRNEAHIGRKPKPGTRGSAR